MLRMWKEAPYNREITGTVVGEAAAAVAKGERASGINEAILQDSGEMYAAVDSEVVDS